jgi:electron transfer flavoprotein beta subunit
MKILCPVKRVVDPYAKVRPLADGSGVDTMGAKFDLNPFDEIALEEAVRIREKNPGTEIIVVTIGEAAAEDQLRKALAMGADRAILVEVTGELDGLGTAKLVGDVVAEVAPDLVLMGKQATDDDGNQVGQMLAARLGWPQASFASRITFVGARAEVARETDDGEEVISVALPAVITADLRLNEPRYIALPAIMRARNKPLERRSATAPKPRVRVVQYGAPPERVPGGRVSTVEELVAALRAKGVLG